MKKGLFITMAAATLLLAGCSNDENEMSNGPVELRLTSGVEVQQTRTYAPTQSTSISTGEVVSVWVDDAGAGAAPTATPKYQAIQLTATSSNGFTGETMYFPQTGNNIDIYAIHGNFSTAFQADDVFPTNGAEYSVEADQSGTTPAHYTNSDLLYAKEKSVARNGNPTTKELTFYHMLSKLELAIKIGSGSPALATSGAVKLGSVTLNGKFTPSTTATMTEQSARAGMLSAAVSTTTADMTLGQKTCADFDSNVDYNEAILVPQEMKDRVLTFTLADGGTLKYRIPAFQGKSDAKFESGKKYIYNITLSLTGLTVTSKIEDWSPVNAVSGTAEM
ncbi:fimbrillin family protein [Phocaeicola sp.]